MISANFYGCCGKHPEIQIKTTPMFSASYGMLNRRFNLDMVNIQAQPPSISTSIPPAQLNAR